MYHRRTWWLGGLDAPPPARPSVSEVRLWAEWVAQSIWADDWNEDDAIRIWNADADVIRKVAAWARYTYPLPHLMAAPKLFHGFRHENPKLKAVRPTEWHDWHLRPSPYRSFTESRSVACVFAHDQQALHEYIRAMKAQGHARADIEHDAQTHEPSLPGGFPLPPPWGHGYIAVLGRNFPQESILHHWRWLHEWQDFGEPYMEACLKPRMPKTLVSQEVLVGNIVHFEVCLDVAYLPTVNVQPYSACLKDRFFRRASFEDAGRYMSHVSRRGFPGPSPAFPTPWIR